jgi:hypothetical protein
VAELASGGVRFCVVGSLALAVHGAPRGTLDVDIVPDTSDENLAGFAALLGTIHAAREPGGAPAELSPDDFTADGELKLYTDLGVLHVLTRVPGVPPYTELEPGSLQVEVGGSSALFCSRDDLVAMKRAAGRLIDLADLERLEEAEEAGA